MIKRNKVYRQITPQQILERVNSYDIYKYYTPVRFDIGDSFCNPHRSDDFPSFSIKFVCGDLHHFDFAVDYWRGRCFDYVMQLYGCSLREALLIVNRDFNLGLEGKTIIPDRNIITWETPKEFKQEPPPLITFSYHKTYSSQQLDYWGKLGVGAEELKKDNIYNPKNIYINHKRLIIPDNELCFIYHYPGDTQRFEGGSAVIYRPLAEKKEKWFKNVTFTYVEHIDKLQGCSKGYLSKSKKGTLFMRSILQTDCIATVQAENTACLNDETLYKFLQCNEKFAIGDNDQTGKTFTMWLTSNYGVRHINAPDYYLTNYGWTDFEDIALHMEGGYKIVKDYFKSKNII